MEGIEDNHWFDMIMDEIGIALSKVDESIQKGIELWTELTKDIFDDQPTQDSTGQPNSEEHFSQDIPVAEVKERPIQHWSMCLGEVKEDASKIPESLIQEQGDGDFYVGDGDDNGNADGEEEEDELTISESWENMWDLDLGSSTSRDIASTLYNHYCEEDSGSSLKRKGGYQLLKNADTSSEDDESWDSDDDEDEEEEEEETVSKSCEDEEGETTVSESSEIMWELNLRPSATSYIPSSNNYHNEEDTGSSLKWTGGYQLLKNVETSSKEDDESCDDDVKVEECHSEDVEEEVEILWNHMSDFSNESVLVHDDEDDVSDMLQELVDGQENISNNTEFGEVETLLPEIDWVFVTRD